MRRSVAMTGYLEALLEPLLAPLGITMITPRDPRARGAQLSLRFGSAAKAESVLARLIARGVIADFRAPDIIRFAPMPLYNRYEELARLVAILARGRLIGLDGDAVSRITDPDRHRVNLVEHEERA